MAGSFFCVLALAIVPICLSRLPAFGCLLYLYPLARRGLMPSPWLLLACVCSALVIHLGELHAKSLEQAGRQRKAAERKPTLDQKAALTQAAREQGEERAMWRGDTYWRGDRVSVHGDSGSRWKGVWLRSAHVARWILPTARALCMGTGVCALRRQRTCR